MAAEGERWALITGANGGIGQALLSTFAEAGYHTIACDLGAQAASVESAYLDVDLRELARSESCAARIVNRVHELTGGAGIEVLVNNAAVQVVAPFSALSRDDWTQTLEVNLLAPFFLSQAFHPSLAACSGSIVNISSIHARQTKRDFIAYATSKAALSAMTRNLALELGDAVRINAIEPAAVETEMLRAGFSSRPGALEQLKQFHPVGRIASPVEIAKTALFLCSGAASFLQGACIPATGGIDGHLYDPEY